MKLPAVALAAAFASGILLGAHRFDSQRFPSPQFLVALSLAIALTLFLGLLFCYQALSITRGTVLLRGPGSSVFSPFALLINPCLPRISSRASQPVSLISTALFAGTAVCAPEPAKTPWGYSLDIDLSGVELAETPRRRPASRLHSSRRRYYTSLAQRLHVLVEHTVRGQAFFWDGVRVDLLRPEISPGEVVPSARNNDSLVIRLSYGDRSVLLPGDAEKQVEYSILEQNQLSALYVDVLKVGHHGSKNSTMPEFLSAVSPQIAIISSGEENPYGHPSPDLLQRLEDRGLRVLRRPPRSRAGPHRRSQLECELLCCLRDSAAQSSRTQTPDNHEHE